MTLAPEKGHTGLRVAAVLAGMLAIGTCMSGMGLVSNGMSPPVTPACPADALCMWEDPDQRGTRYTAYVPNFHGKLVKLHWWHGANEISSVRNNTGLWVTLWDNANGTGAHRCIPPSDTDANVVPNLALDAFDNEIESFTLQTDSTCRPGQPATGHSAH